MVSEPDVSAIVPSNDPHSGRDGRPVFAVRGPRPVADQRSASLNRGHGCAPFWARFSRRR
jgi:hypothetical protein